MLVGAVIGRPCKIRKGATDDRPYEEYDGRQKPLLEDRCHEVTEWWLEVINRYLCGELTILLFYIIIN